MKISNNDDLEPKNTPQDGTDDEKKSISSTKYGIGGQNNGGGNNGKKKKKSPNEPHIPKWVWWVIAAVCVIGAYMYSTNKKHDTTDTKPKTAQVDKKKKQEDKLKQEEEKAKKARDEALQREKEEKAEKEAEKSLKDQDKGKGKKKTKWVSGVPTIKKFFTTMNVYNDAKESQYQIAKKLLKYADRDVVNTVMPNALQNRNSAKSSIITVGKLYKPLNIQKDGSGAKGVYDVGVWRSVSAGKTVNKYNDSYVITTNAKGKIIDIDPKSSTVE